MQKLIQRIALVTGGASGLGKAIAQRLASEGARVVVSDVQAALGEQMAAESGCDFMAQDVTDESRWSSIVREIEDRYGGLHILINNAGIVGSRTESSPEGTLLADWKKVFAVNVESVFLGCRAALPVIHASGGGAIVNVSSVAGLLATPYATAYGASKAAVRQMTKSVAQHCVEKGWNIRCNSVHPGNVRTALWDRQAAEAAHQRGITFDEFLREQKATVPMGDLTTLEDIAAAVLFLASDESRHITGSKLIVDGGIVHCDTFHMRSSSHTSKLQG